MAHGAARPCSGLAGLAMAVASSPEHLLAMAKARRGLGKDERAYVVLATVSSNSDEVRRRWKLKCGHYLGFFGSTARWTS